MKWLEWTNSLEREWKECRTRVNDIACASQKSGNEEQDANTERRSGATDRKAIEQIEKESRQLNTERRSRKAESKL